MHNDIHKKHGIRGKAAYCRTLITNSLGVIARRKLAVCENSFSIQWKGQWSLAEFNTSMSMGASVHVNTRKCVFFWHVDGFKVQKAKQCGCKFSSLKNGQQA